ncbi:hypothetical protein [uncultured Erythrobacter sp.]|uniref:hypothetical protein n=1 Tax=uncultured Erythrobacter sp. TaxID=263913 RepID=UPI0026070558|nr:hypothetical protein [uncultured Erythrobacter sp.]
MRESNKSTWETILQSGGVAVTTIGLIATGITGYFTFIGGGQSAETEIYKADSEAQTAQMEAESEERTSLCGKFFDYLGDETPNTALSEVAQTAVDEMIVQNSENCSIFDETASEALFDNAVPEEVPNADQGADDV